MLDEKIIEIKDVDVSFYVQRKGIINLRDFILSVGFKKPFEKKKILHHINLTIYKGESIGLLGRNGAGKSTLLRTIAGILPCESGTIVLNGKVAPMLSLGVGLEPELSGYDNIRYLSLLIGRSKKQTEDSISFIKSFSELSEEDLQMAVKRYSSGMLARLSFSISVAHVPEILIIDEALSVGDLGFQRKCTKRIDELKKAGVTLLYVSHNLSEIKRICERAIILQKGIITHDGPVDEVADQYLTLFKS